MVKIDKENSLFITGVVIANGVADSDGDVLTKKEIKQLNSSYLSQNTDTNHDFLENYGVKIIENYISKVKETVGDREVPIGSWICKMIIWDNKLKEQIRQGRINGLSLASQPDSNKPSHDDVFNKRNTYSQFKDMDELTPTFISLVENPANGYDLDYYSYKSYITKNNKIEDTIMTDENSMGSLANKLLDALLKSKETETTEKEVVNIDETVTKAAPPQGGVAPMQQQAPQQGYGQQPVSLESVNAKLDQILSIIGGGQQTVKSEVSDNSESVDKKKKCTKDEDAESADAVEKEDKTNDETQEPVEDGKDKHNTGSVSTDGKSDVKPTTQTEGSVPGGAKQKKVLKSEAPQTTHVENISNNEKTYKSYENHNATKRDLMGRQLRD